MPLGADDRRSRDRAGTGWGVIRHGQLDPEQAQHAAAERLGLPRGNVEHQPQGEHQLDRHVGVERLQVQPIAQPAEHHEGDDVAGQAGPVQHAAAAFVELPPAVPAPEASIAPCRHHRLLRHGCGPTANARHPVSPTTLTIPTLRDRSWSSDRRSGASADRTVRSVHHCPR